MVSILEILANKSNYGSLRSASVIDYIVIHYTANDGDTDTANARYFQSPNRGASAHYFVDDDSITRSVPELYVAWSVGGNKYSDCAKTGGGKLYKICKNTNSISIEMCDTIKNGVYDVSEKTLNNVYDLVVMLMKKYDIDINHVIRHFDVTGKHCPSYYMDESKWKQFKQAVIKRYDGEDSNTAPTPLTAKPVVETTITYTYGEFVKDVQKAINVTADGIVGEKTLAATPTISIAINKYHTAVTPIQKYLKVLGYYKDTVDGKFGPNTEKAVIDYQKTFLKIPDGEITSKGTTWKKLLKYTVTTTTTTNTATVYDYNQFVKDVQKAINVTVDGIVGIKTLAATPTLSTTKNKAHAAVIPVQKYLKVLGYYKDTVDGKFGPNTKTAVINYQKTFLKIPDGEITSKGTTWKKLLKY